ncbi:hypothetical protein Smp_124260, partial [Schistosoma mansoni]
FSDVHSRIVLVLHPFSISIHLSLLYCICVLYTK